MHKFSPRHRLSSRLLGYEHRPPKDSHSCAQVPLAAVRCPSTPYISEFLIIPSQNLPQNKLYHANLLYIAPSPTYREARQNYHTNIDIEPRARYGTSTPTQSPQVRPRLDITSRRGVRIEGRTKKETCKEQEKESMSEHHMHTHTAYFCPGSGRHQARPHHESQAT